MPNDLNLIKGPYELNRRNRRYDVEREEFRRRYNARMHMPQPKMSFLRLLKLVAYFSIFYIVLATFTWVYIKIVFLILEKNDEPFQSKAPGLSSVPGHMTDNTKQIIWRSDFPTEVEPIRDQIENFIKPFGINVPHHLGTCNLDEHWGYVSKRPCVLLKLNYSHNFTVVTYDDGITLPDEVPMDLYNYIIETSEEMRFNRIWLDCAFREPQESAYFDYIPHRYYDILGLFQEQFSYLQFLSENLSEIKVHENPAHRRIVAVQLLNLPPNKDIHFTCVIWAKNIPLSRGTLHFMLHLKEV